VTRYNNFNDALQHFRICGGGMIYYPPCGFITWSFEVGDYDSIKAQILPGCSVRESTEYALVMGGMSEENIREELDGWID
jgi:hypothetical protein